LEEEGGEVEGVSLFQRSRSISIFKFFGTPVGRWLSFGDGRGKGQFDPPLSLSQEGLRRGAKSLLILFNWGLGEQKLLFLGIEEVYKGIGDGDIKGKLEEFPVLKVLGSTQRRNGQLKGRAIERGKTPSPGPFNWKIPWFNWG
jgi:hypothetical protein